MYLELKHYHQSFAERQKPIDNINFTGKNFLPDYYSSSYSYS